MDFPSLPRLHFAKQLGWTLLVCVIIVIVTAGIARATLNLSAALVEKPDLAVYVLDPTITDAQLLRERTDRRDYFVTSPKGHELLKLRKHEGKWEIDEREALRE